LQMESMKLQGQIKLEELSSQADIEEVKVLHVAEQPKLTGWKFVDGIIALYQSSVRPTLTYGFFVFYGLVKFSQYKLFIASNYNNWQIVYGLWNQEDMAIFSTVISFWFGSRFLKYALQRNGEK